MNTANPFSIFECDDLDAGVTAVSSTQGRLATAQAALAFMRGGNATVTLVSVKTGTRFTYRLRAAEDNDTLFVGLLTGPDNETAYSYLGRVSRGLFWAGRKVPKAGDISADAPSSKAFAWAWRALIKGNMPEALEVYHEGRCARCARKLTVPSSIESGFGPECAGKIGLP
jgi:hypothetical protein